jgi:hypothetical protein
MDDKDAYPRRNDASRARNDEAARDQGSEPDTPAAPPQEPEWTLPAAFVDALFDTVPGLSGPVYDPFAGSGCIPRVARRRGLSAYASDLVERGDPDVVPGVDIADGWPLVNEPGAIVSAPPSEHAQRALISALVWGPHHVAFLMPLTKLTDPRLRDTFTRIAPPSGVIAIADDRHPGRGATEDGDHEGAPQAGLGWFVWELRHIGEGRPWLAWA